MQNSTNSDDDFLAWIVGLIAVTIFGPGLLASVVPKVQTWLVDAHVLVTDKVLIPIGTGAGLDLARIAIAAGALALAATLTVFIVRARLRRAAAERRVRA